MLYAFDKRYGTCKFVWYSVVLYIHLYRGTYRCTGALPDNGLNIKYRNTSLQYDILVQYTVYLMQYIVIKTTLL